MLEQGGNSSQFWYVKLLRFFFSSLFGKKSQQKFWKFVHLLALKGRHFGMGGTVETSGEVYVTQYVKNKVSKPIVFDVGANAGDYALETLQEMDAKVYCFEPSPTVFQRLQKNLAGKNVVLNNVGLSDKEESAKLYYFETHSGISSLYKQNLEQYNIPITDVQNVKLITLDDYCAANGITKIDLLKMDVEGHEMKVLNGAQKMLSSIRFVQWEMGRTSVASHTFFKDFYDLLSPDYQIYRILKDGLLPIKEYEVTEEVFITTNYFAERKR